MAWSGGGSENLPGGSDEGEAARGGEEGAMDFVAISSGCASVFGEQGISGGARECVGREVGCADAFGQGYCRLSVD